MIVVLCIQPNIFVTIDILQSPIENDLLQTKYKNFVKIF